jgi:polyhydroxybutyrate depolymerase
MLTTLSALLGSPQPQNAGAAVVLGLGIVWSVGMGSWLIERSETGACHQPPEDSRAGFLGKLLAGLCIGCSLAMAAALFILGVIVGPVTWARATGRTGVGELRVGEIIRSYRVHRPQGLPARTSLVIVLHGAWGSGFQAEVQTGFDTQADVRKWIVVYPDGVSDGWDTFGDSLFWGKHPRVDDVAFIAALVDRFETTGEIDPSRVYVTGFSRGGMMAYRVGCELSSRVAAIAPVSGNMASSDGRVDDVDCKLKRPVSILVIHGSADPVVPLGGGHTDINYAPLADVIGKWRTLDSCSGSFVTNTWQVTTSTTWACPEGTSVEMKIVLGGVHAWPGSRGNPVFTRNAPDQSFDASALIADFFDAHKRNGGSEP